MKNLKTFLEYVAEAQEFDPSKTTDIDPVLPPVQSTSELIAGKEYVIKSTDKEYTDMLLVGIADGSYLFDSEDLEDVLRFSREEMEDLVSKGAIQQVAE